MNFKRKRPKSGRAGCLLCKPHKRQGWSHARRYPIEAAVIDQQMASLRELHRAEGD